MNTRAVAAAAFSTSPAKPCSTQSFGDCTLTTVCSDPEAIDYVSAGTVTVTMSAGGITLTPDSRNIYESMRLPSYLGGTEQVNISAAGSTIPAFSADLTVPLVLLIESPKPDANGIVQARMSEDLVIQFSRGTTGVELYVGFGDGTFVCRSAAGASSMTITKDALAMLGSYATFSLWTRYRQEVAAGDFTVTTSVYMDAMSPDKKNPVVVEVQ